MTKKFHFLALIAVLIATPFAMSAQPADISADAKAQLGADLYAKITADAAWMKANGIALTSKDLKPLPENETATVFATATMKGNVHHRYLFVTPADAEKTIAITGLLYPSTITLLDARKHLDYTYTAANPATKAPSKLIIKLPAALRTKLVDIIDIELPAVIAPTPAKDLVIAAQTPEKLWQPSDGPNSPMGAARGIHPGRVTWIRDLRATPWDGRTGNWWQDGTGINQPAVDNMFARSICALALSNPQSEAAAWDALFRNFNKTRGAGDRGYRAGEKIAIKVNLNNAYSGHTDADNQIDASPQTICALLYQLTKNAGVPETAITVYEGARYIPDRVYKKCHDAFPGVTYVDSTGGDGRVKVEYVKDVLHYSVPNRDEKGKPIVGEDLPTCVTEATYLINMALVKAHPSTGLSLTAKNHYGTVNVRDHNVYVNTYAHPHPDYHPFVDMIGSNQLGAKTLLYILDGLYGLRDVNDDVSQTAHWDKLFHGEYLASIFMSQDPIAIDSVGLDFLRSEFPAGRKLPQAIANSDFYMHEGALADHPPSGAKYAPNDEPLKSLGVHEHWNNPTDKKYSRNLDPQNGKGIELHTVPAE